MHGHAGARKDFVKDAWIALAPARVWTIARGKPPKKHQNKKTAEKASNHMWILVVDTHVVHSARLVRPGLVAAAGMHTLGAGKGEHDPLGDEIRGR